MRSRNTRRKSGVCWNHFFDCHYVALFMRFCIASFNILHTAATTRNGNSSQTRRDFSKIVAKHSGKCLDDGMSSNNDGGVVHQWSRHNGNNQQWKVTPTEDGCYFIISKIGGLSLDADHGSPKIHLWSFHGGENQKWRFKRFLVEEPRNETRFSAVKKSGKFDNTLDLRAVIAVYSSKVDLLRLDVTDFLGFRWPGIRKSSVTFNGNLHPAVPQHRELMPRRTERGDHTDHVKASRSFGT